MRLQSWRRGVGGVVDEAVGPLSITGRVEGGWHQDWARGDITPEHRTEDQVVRGGQLDLSSWKHKAEALCFTY